MFFGSNSKQASEIPQFVILLGIAIVLGGAAVWAILSSSGTQGNNASNWITSLGVPVTHP